MNTPTGDDERDGDAPSQVVRHDPYLALRYRDFRLLTMGTLMAALGSQMVGVAVGWELYELTNDPIRARPGRLVQMCRCCCCRCLPVISPIVSTAKRMS